MSDRRRASASASPCLSSCSRAADRPVGPAGQCDQPFAMLLQRLDRHLRCLAGRCAQKRPADQFDQIVVTAFVLGQEHHRFRLRLAAKTVSARFAGNAHDAADDRLHARRRHRAGKLHRAEQVAAVGDRHRRHPVFLAELDQLLDLHRPFRQRIGGVDAQMDEVGMRHRAVYPSSTRRPSARRRRRSIRAARSGLCVAIRAATPCSRTSSTNVAKT